MTEVTTSTGNTPEETAAAVAEDTGFETSEWEVRCAGVTYFEITEVMGPHGKPLRDPQNSSQNLLSTVRRFANKGAIIELTEYEAARLLKEEAIQKPGSALIRGIHADAPILPTPFTSPIRAEDGTVNSWDGPVMGDPRPSAGAADVDIVGATIGGALTPDQIAEAQLPNAIKEGKLDPDQDPDLSADEQDSYNSYKELDKDDLVAEAKEREVEVVRRDGKDGDPLKDDYAFALAKDDHTPEEDED